MNLFSQSKLALKLKKTNCLLSTASNNDSEKLATNNTLNSELLSNNSIVSEKDSFVEILQSVPHDELKSMSQNVFKSSDPNVSIIINENKQCPVCLLMIDDNKFINHVKSCGTSHNLSSEVLIKAVNLQKRQESEREALGLPKLTNNPDFKKKRATKTTKSKIGYDSNLDLAIAMSVSLQESKEAEIIKESETLLEAGLEKEAIEKKKTLESFGFISNQPVKSKYKFSKSNSLLFKQTKEEREKRITEKVAMVLIDCDDKQSKTVLNYYTNSKLISTYLNRIRNVDNELWTKSTLEAKNIHTFYVKKLSKFIKPSESNLSYCNNNYASVELQNTSKHESFSDNKELIIDNTLQNVIDNSKFDNISVSSHNIMENKTILNYSSKWKIMVGNQMMSDITIFAKNGHEIPAHSLVFHVQCPNILDDIVTKESNTTKQIKMIMWMEYLYEACLAFLEFVYSGQESFISSEFKDDYLKLGTKYNVLMNLHGDEKHRWISEKQKNVSKRKTPEFVNNSIDCKRYKPSSPDMFMSNDENLNFLEATVNDEKSLSILKTKQWLYNCNLNQHYHNTSFRENFVLDVPTQTLLPDKSPSHSFHSASTVGLQHQSTPSYIDIMDSENNVEHINPLNDVNSSSSKSLSTDGSSVKAVLMCHKIKSYSNHNIVTETPALTNSCTKPEIITINSDSESNNTILSTKIVKSYNNFKSIWNENIETSLSKLNTNKSNEKLSFNSSNNHELNIIELNDNSLDSNNSACTKVIPRNYDKKTYNSLSHDYPMLNLRNKSLKTTNDENNEFIAVANVLPINNFNTQALPFSDNKIIVDSLEDSSSDSISIINITGSLKNSSLVTSTPTSLNNIQQNYRKRTIPNLKTKCETNNSILDLSSFKKDYSSNNSFLSNGISFFPRTNFDFNSNNSPDNKILSNYKNDLILTKSPKKINDLSSNLLCTTSNLNKPIPDSKNVQKTIIKPPIICDNLLINTKEYIDLTSCPSNENIFNHTSTISISTQDKNQLPEVINTSKISILDDSIHEQNKSSFKQIIDDPWMDYNNWDPVYNNPQDTSPVISKNNSVNKVDEPDLQALSVLNHSHANIDYHKKDATTPNKYGSKLNTPKSLRRIQSESVIGSKEQFTPLPDYSAMKTPDLRKEFDRYGLKDLGRQKGKLILRHIYNELHPIYTFDKANCNLKQQQHLDSSDSSECGIPDNEVYEECFDELENISQANLSNKTSVEIGFRQLLRVNEDLHKKILCYEPIWIEELKENLKQCNINISMHRLMTFLDDKCITFRMKSFNNQKQKTVAKKYTKRKKLF